MGQFDVGIQALRRDVSVWDQQSTHLRQIADQVDGLRMDRLEAGIFQVFVSAYHDAVTQVTGRAGEGSAAMDAVAATLSDVADAYQRNENANTRRFTDLR